MVRRMCSKLSYAIYNFYIFSSDTYTYTCKYNIILIFPKLFVYPPSLLQYILIWHSTVPIPRIVIFQARFAFLRRPNSRALRMLLEQAEQADQALLERDVMLCRSPGEKTSEKTSSSSPLSKQRLELVRTWIESYYFCCIFVAKQARVKKERNQKSILDRCSGVRKQILLGFYTLAPAPNPGIRSAYWMQYALWSKTEIIDYRWCLQRYNSREQYQIDSVGYCLLS